MKKFYLIPMVVIIAAIVSFAGDDMGDIAKSLGLPAWVNTFLGLAAGAGIIGGVLAKILPRFTAALRIIKKLLKLIELIKPTIQDAAVMTEYNGIVDELELVLKNDKSRTGDFLEKYKLKAKIDPEKVLNAVKLSVSPQ